MAKAFNDQLAASQPAGSSARPAAAAALAAAPWLAFSQQPAGGQPLAYATGNGVSSRRRNCYHASLKARKSAKKAVISQRRESLAKHVALAGQRWPAEALAGESRTIPSAKAEISFGEHPAAIWQSTLRGNTAACGLHQSA
jgi:hypothetical protein